MEPERASEPDSSDEHWIDWTVRGARRVAVAVVGGTVLLIGLALLVLPGPAFVVIPIGLGILSLEFAWATRWLKHVKDQAQRAFGATPTPEPKREDEARGLTPQDTIPGTPLEAADEP